MKDPTSQLRSATRRAKSDVANKLISMFLHELSRRVSQDWPIKIGSEDYEKLVRERFNNRCPYCLINLAETAPVVEHLDGMNRNRAGLHVPGNVLVACRKCNSEKRRDDSLKVLPLAKSGWASFLSHDGTRCAPSCATCGYWKSIWTDEAERKLRLAENLQRILSFRSAFPEFERTHSTLMETLPALLTKLYSDCQAFAETEISSLLERFEGASGTQV
ncbi:MAG: HNH endonuclease signature motif containing protein [Terriglobia bacterium]